MSSGRPPENATSWQQVHATLGLASLITSSLKNASLMLMGFEGREDFVHHLIEALPETYFFLLDPTPMDQAEYRVKAEIKKGILNPRKSQNAPAIDKNLAGLLEAFSGFIIVGPAWDERPLYQQAKHIMLKQPQGKHILQQVFESYKQSLSLKKQLQAKSQASSPLSESGEAMQPFPFYGRARLNQHSYLNLWSQGPVC